MPSFSSFEKACTTPSSRSTFTTTLLPVLGAAAAVLLLLDSLLDSFDLSFDLWPLDFEDEVVASLVDEEDFLLFFSFVESFTSFDAVADEDIVSGSEGSGGYIFFIASEEDRTNGLFVWWLNVDGTPRV